MNAREIFGIILRVIGVGCVGYGLRYVISWVYVEVRNNAPAGYTGFDYLLAGLYYLIVGLFLLRGSHHVVRFAYPQERANNGENCEEHKAV